MNETLFDELYNAAEYFRICDLYEQIKDRYTNDILDAQVKYMEMKERKSNPKPINVLFIIPGVLILLVALVSTVVIGGFHGTGLMWIMSAVNLIIIPVLNTTRCKRLSHRYQEEADSWWNKEGGYIVAEDEKNYDKAQKELQAFQESNRHIPLILPPRYRNHLAAQFIALAVGNCRADSLKEAINLYEEQCHRWEVEAAMQQTAQNIAAYHTQVEESLNHIYDQQARTHRTLQNIENLEIYRMLRSE